MFPALTGCSSGIFNTLDFTFDYGWMFGGLVISAIGGAIVFFYRQIADNFASGVRSYDKVKLFGIITLVIGFLVTANLHTFFLSLLVDLISKN